MVTRLASASPQKPWPADTTGDSAGPPLDPCGESAGLKGGDEQGAARIIRRHLFAVGEIDVDARSEAAVDIEYRQSGAFARDEVTRHEQDAGARRGRSLLGGAARKA